MSARSISKGLLDARFSKLRALQALGGGGGGSLLPLPRDAFISSDSTVSGESGSVAEPFKSIPHWLATQAAAGKTVGDNSTLSVGRLLPAVAGYTAALTIPAYRSLELRGDDAGGQLTPVSGGITWHNTALAAAGGPAPPACIFVLHNINEQGALTVTDDGTVPGNVIVSGDEIVGEGVASGINALGATAISAILVYNQAVLGGVESITGASGAELVLVGATIGGSVIGRVLAAENTGFNSSVINVGNSSSGAAIFINCTFFLGSGPVVTGLAGSAVIFDGPSWKSFQEAGGSVVTSVVLVNGGYSGGAVLGTAIGNLAANLSLNGLAGGSTNGQGNLWLQTAAVTAADKNIKFLSGGGELLGDTIRVTRTVTDANGFHLVFQDDTGGTIGTLACANRGFFEVRWNGSHWVMNGGGGGLT